MSDGTETVIETPVEEAVPVEETPQEPVEEQEEATEDEEEPESQDDLREKPKRGKSAHARIDELTRKFRSTERELEYYKRLATGQAQTTAHEAAPKPDRNLFASEDEYVEALTDWKVGEALAKTQSQAAKQTAEGLRNTAWEARIEEASASIPDFAEVVGNSTVPVAAHVYEAIKESARGPELAYHMALNPSVVVQLNRLSPLQAAMELARMESSLAQPKAKAAPKPLTKAPPPATPINAAASTDGDPAKMSMDDYIAWRAKQGAGWAKRQGL